MNILYLDASRGLGPPGRMLLTLLERMDRSRFSPYVILSNDADDADLRLVTALRRAHVPTLQYRLAPLRRSKRAGPWSVLSLGGALLDSVTLAVRLIKKYHIDIVQSDSGAVLTGALAAWVARVPHIRHVNETINYLDAGRLPSMLDRLSTYVVTASEQAAKSLAEHRPATAGKLRVIKIGVDPEPFRNVDQERIERLREEWGIGPEQKVVATVSRTGMGKSEENFLRMAQLVRPQVDQVKFAIDLSNSLCGAFDNCEYAPGKIQTRADAMGLGRDVIVPGHTEDMPAVMNLIDLLVQLPDSPESLGLEAAEAMAAGTPAVVAATGGLPEVVCDFETGYHVPPGDVQAAAGRVVELLTNDRLRKHMGKAAYRRVDREFSPERYVKQFEQLYEEVG